MDFISKLQGKPEGTRRQIAFFMTACAGLLVIAIWAALSFLSLTQSSSAPQATSNSPFQTIKTRFSNIGKAFNDQKESIKKSFNFQQ